MNQACTRSYHDESSSVGMVMMVVEGKQYVDGLDTVTRHTLRLADQCRRAGDEPLALALSDLAEAEILVLDMLVQCDFMLPACEAEV